MKILVTGAKGFIGRNFVVEARNRGYETVYEYDRDSSLEELDDYCKNADIVYHFAGVNRPEKLEEFTEGNVDFTKLLLEKLAKHNNKATIVVSSSIQASLDNPYGRSKLSAEKELIEYGELHGTRVLVYRLANVFGKWCRPNYNSVVATFCHNIANDLPIKINDESTELNLVYIDDVVKEFLSLIDNDNREKTQVEPVYTIKLGRLAELIRSFKTSRNSLVVPDMSDGICKNLYSTYLSYLPKEDFSYELISHRDHRGSFTEFIKTVGSGQVSINVSKPGITKGNHWHHTKNEKFLVVSGEGIIRFRKIDSDEVIEYKVSGESLSVVDIPVGYTHNIENIGTTDMVTVMWANESFDPNNPDTYFLEV